MIPISSTASPHGVSHYGDYYALAQKLANPRDTSTVPEDDALLVGTMVHALLRWHREGVAIDRSGVFTWSDGTPLTDRLDCQAEAFRVFEDYLLRFPEPDELGTVVGTEVPLGVPDFLGTGYPLTGAADAITRVDDFQASRIRSRRKVEISPGLYIIDDKTAGRNDKGMVEKFQSRRQFKAYMALWNLMNPADPIAGTLVNIIIKTKVPQYLTVVVPPPLPAEIDEVREFVRIAGHMKSQLSQIQLLTPQP